MHEKVALKHSSKSTKYELEGSYDDLVHELSWTCQIPVFVGLVCMVVVVVAWKTSKYGDVIRSAEQS